MWQNQIHNLQGWRRFVFGARTRVIASYVVLVVFSTVFSLLAIRHILIARVEEQIEASLRQEVEEFRRLVKGRNPKTGQPFGDDLASIFDVYLRRNVPHDDEFLLTLLNGKLYKSSPIGLPDSLHPDSVVNRWAKLTEPEDGETVTPAGPIRYLAEPIRITGKTRGVFMVAFLPASKYEEVNHVVFIVGVVEGILAVIALTSSIAWLAAGRILSRLRLLSETARVMSESDLTQRIPVQGSDEITELTITFNEMLERLQVAFTSQRDFINDAGHELRTPITIVRCYLEQIRVESPEQREMLALVLNELERMSRFVNDLLLLAKAEQPNFLNLEIVEIGSLTEELYTKASTLAVRNWCLEAKGSGRMIADPQRLTQAVMNLVQNAVQYTKEGDAIALGSTLSDDKFHFWVRDTGVGIPPANQERIFQRFVRGDGGRRLQGAGLGLAIVKAIAEAHGGGVELISQPGSGSTFTIVIPV
ncbi:MAG: HAMP domain-containing protein [Cyanobacteria bacterium CRU_2_1]|nr:HAMP domain-containing protein [Scytonema sp. RU_4_4]NJR63043.1 HAMP domain-containing protein [Cyanobacteria bacterium CRU_2_1]